MSLFGEVRLEDEDDGIAREVNEVKNGWSFLEQKQGFKGCYKYEHQKS